MMSGTLRILWAALFLALPAVVIAQTNIVTYHNDAARTGQNTNETLLTPANVSSATFGKLFSYTVDGEVYAQPLYLAGVNIPGHGIHNVIYIATQHDSVYAFDADSNAGANSTALWHVSFINPASGITTLSTSDVSCSLISPETGITATPVIDPTTGTLYVVAETKENGTVVQRLHALDVITGAEKFGGPMQIQPSVPGTGDGSSNGTVTLNMRTQTPRAGLLLLGGVVYVAWGSPCDVYPYHGWVVGFDAATLAQKSAFNSTPNGSEGGIWQGGGGLGADASGNIYFGVGNGSFDANTGGKSYGDSAVKLSTASGLSVADYFTPYNQQSLSNADSDFGSGGVLLLPDQVSTPHPHLLIATDKPGTIYVIDRDNMGHFSASGNGQIVQSITSALGYPMLGTPAWWNNFVYLCGAGDPLHAYNFTPSNDMLSSAPASSSGATFGTGTTASISSSGTNNAIVWAIDASAAGSGPAVLHAFDATNLSRELYNTNQNSARDNPGTAVKFTVPTITNGKVYVGANARVTAYGLLAPTPDFVLAVTPQSQTVNAGSSTTYTVTISPQNGFSGTVSLTISGLGNDVNATFNPQNLTTANSSSVLTVTTTSRSQSPQWLSNRQISTPLIILVGAILIMVWIAPLRARVKLSATACLCLALAASCGHSTNSINGTPAGSEMLTITGAAGTLSHSITATLTVN